MECCMSPCTSTVPAGRGWCQALPIRADAAILVFDVTDVESFRRVRSWVAELRQMVRMCPENVVGRMRLWNLACALMMSC
jgi:Ras family